MTEYPLIERDKEQKSASLLKEIGECRMSELYQDYAIKEFRKRVMTLPLEHRTDASRTILTLLDLIEEQIAKHNGILKRKSGTLEKKRDRVRYQ